MSLTFFLFVFFFPVVFQRYDELREPRGERQQTCNSELKLGRVTSMNNNKDLDVDLRKEDPKGEERKAKKGPGNEAALPGLRRSEARA